jgi:hypothetical protein
MENGQGAFRAEASAFGKPLHERSLVEFPHAPEVHA